ncbi:hypothetical protein ACRQ5Q_42045 (plasmid) [Bradyrhizobium sp. PMVTL-01]|uniref:hypothetical protein n=1 Tax=Bradyrhizobium sp. PMVTL-01 TaxID=3434999 RepID=UPI003F72CBDA
MSLAGRRPRWRDPKAPGRAAVLESTRQFNADGSVTKFDHVTAAGDGAGFITCIGWTC